MSQKPYTPRPWYRLYAGLLAVFVLSACLPQESDRGAAGKPDNPLQLRISPLETVTPGNVVPFEVEVLASSPLSNVVVTVALPPQLPREAGQLYWQGDLHTDTPQRFTFSVTIPPKGVYRLQATAVVSGGNGHISNEATYLIGDKEEQINSGIRLAPHPAPPTQDDHPVTEYRLK